jgi:CRP/FNR family cyclic AMP-dependent transcriptional regulator
MDLVQVIRRTAMFSGLSVDEATEFARHCTPAVFSTGEDLFHEGEPATWLFIVVVGEIAISCQAPTGDAVVVGRAGPGSVLGEMAVLEGSLRSATATATVPVTALRLDSATFAQLIDDGHPAAGRILAELRRTLVSRLRAVNARLDALFEAEVDLGAAPAAPEPEPGFRSPLRALWHALVGGDR